MYRHTRVKDVENVLILQGGGSLGAFAWGVVKLLQKNKKFDIIAGTSIGAKILNIKRISREDSKTPYSLQKCRLFCKYN
jgi:predicted patatin/cPLA2 family phospholipase